MGRSKNLTKEERHTIHIDLKDGLKPAEIARKLGRSRSCITKEIALNPISQLKMQPNYKNHNPSYKNWQNIVIFYLKITYYKIYNKLFTTIQQLQQTRARIYPHQLNSNYLM